VDAAYYDAIATRLRGLLTQFSVRLPADCVGEIAHFVDHNELGVALENMARALAELRAPISLAERGEMLSLAELMDLGDDVPALLGTLPGRT
jgi:hypothetical protein